MFRLLGFCLGSLASMGLLFLLVGTPDFHLADDDADRTRFDEAVEKLKAKQPLPPPAPGPVPPESVAETAPPAAAVSDNAVPELPAADGGELPGPAIEPDEPAELLALAAPEQQEWHSFWTPFRTKIAAAGFVGRLESVTGLDYRIVKTGKAGYEVEFSYSDATELDGKLERISAATGLDLSHNLP